ncbi:hypothetical protein I7I50_10615 [Histoplasma capsulatum G186AR]|uniref:Uncharacterized protein n=1 Tax=Ajellomyces capsulatus TaxID=5037 RepID=A0A8H7Z9Q4_AJECA|nr:hypothetical protein I7I52_01853 [Histoplasma capsulatum]QSS69345.1 hypothetical protein I7I50_10615 [Histoplasma capsulatum G186AR]
MQDIYGDLYHLFFCQHHTSSSNIQSILTNLLSLNSFILYHSALVMYTRSKGYSLRYFITDVESSSVELSAKF